MTDDRRIAWNPNRRTFLKHASAIAAAATVADRAAWAAEWPVRPVSIIVPYVAGGTSDMMARLLARYVSERVGKPFVVENRGGGAGVPASMLTASATPDGCTVMFGPSSPYVITPALQPVNYSADSFTPISNFATYTYFVGVKASLPVRTMAELIAYAKQHPGKLNYSSAGNGSFSHLLTALLAAQAGIDVTHVPYKGAAPATMAVLAGEVDFCMSGVPDLMSYMSSSDRVRIIATSTPTRSAEFPQLAAINEAVPGYSADTWNGVVGPKGIPRNIVDKFSALIREAARQPEIVAQLKKVGIQSVESTPDELGKKIAQDREVYGAAIKAAGLG